MAIYSAMEVNLRSFRAPPTVMIRGAAEGPSASARAVRPSGHSRTSPAKAWRFPEVQGYGVRRRIEHCKQELVLGNKPAACPRLNLMPLPNWTVWRRSNHCMREPIARTPGSI